MIENIPFDNIINFILGYATGAGCTYYIIKKKAEKQKDKIAEQFQDIGDF